MSYIVARMVKMKSGNLGGAYRHNERIFKNHANKDIDTSRSHLNYELTDRDRSVSYERQIKDYVTANKSSKRAIRRDAVLCDEWIVTSDTKFFEQMTDEQVRAFFETARYYFAENYGKKNIAYASVHLDETTPHMHLGVVPLRDGKLSSKAMFTCEELKYIQEDLPRYMAEHGFELDRGKRNSEAKHKTVAEFKEAKADIELKIELTEVLNAPLFIDERTGEFFNDSERYLEAKFWDDLWVERPDKIVRETTNQEKMEWLRNQYRNELRELSGQKTALLSDIQRLGEVEREILRQSREMELRASEGLSELSEIENQIKAKQEVLAGVEDRLRPLEDEIRGFDEILEAKRYEAAKIDEKASRSFSELENAQEYINTLERRSRGLEGQIEALESEYLDLAKRNSRLADLDIMSEGELGQIKPKKNVFGKEHVELSLEQFEKFKGLIYLNKNYAHNKEIELANALAQLPVTREKGVFETRLEQAVLEAEGSDVMSLKSEISELRKDNSILRQQNRKMLEVLDKVLPSKALSKLLDDLRAIKPIVGAIKTVTKVIERSLGL